MTSPGSKPTILVVDDTPENIDVLNGILGSLYKVKVAKSGEKAIQLAQNSLPDLILLDVMMPEMDGFQVCKELKKNNKTKKIPIIFVTAKDAAEDENYGFEMGGVDYITKPVNPVVVRARVKTHLELRSAQVRVEQLLSRTLLGSVKMMTHILSFLAPETFSRSSRIKKYVRDLAQALEVPEIWRLEMAGMLSQLGCLTVPQTICEKVIKGIALSENEQKVYDSHPELGAEFLSHIPGLDMVANIIRDQLTVCQPSSITPPDGWDFVTLGASLLKVSQEYDRLMINGETSKSALSIMRQNPQEYAPTLVSLLDKTQETREIVSRLVGLDELREGMILDQDLVDESKVKIAGNQTELNHETIRLISRFNKNCEIPEPVKVLIQVDS